MALGPFVSPRADCLLRGSAVSCGSMACGPSLVADTRFELAWRIFFILRRI